MILAIESYWFVSDIGILASASYTDINSAIFKVRIVDGQAHLPSPVPLDEITARVACSARWHAGHLKCAANMTCHEVCEVMPSNCSQRWKLARQIHANTLNHEDGGLRISSIESKNTWASRAEFSAEDHQNERSKTVKVSAGFRCFHRVYCEDCIVHFDRLPAQFLVMALAFRQALRRSSTVASIDTRTFFVYNDI